MVEVFCSILSGANAGPNVRSWKEFGKIANLVGICSILSGANAGPNVRSWKEFVKIANLVGIM